VSPDQLGSDSRAAPRPDERFIVIGVVVVVLGATIGAVAYESFNGSCPNPTGQEGLHIVSAPSVVWDEQALLGMDVNETVMTTNVTVTSANDSNGYGPVYLLNGLANSGYWYQLGLAFDWGADGGYAVGAEIVTSVFAPGSPTTPIFQLLGSVNVGSGDLVTLTMSLSGGCASLTLSDAKTHMALIENYNLEDSTRFVSYPVPGASVGYFSGLMTEWWHVNPYYGPTSHGVYSLPQRSGSFVGLGISERIPGTGQLLFANSTRGNLALPQTWTLSFQNVTESVNQVAFTTQ
jgi:hypothetical protein